MLNQCAFSPGKNVDIIYILELEDCLNKNCGNIIKNRDKILLKQYKKVRKPGKKHTMK